MLERFHQKFLRHILGLKAECFISDTEILHLAHCSSVEQHILSQGHLCLPKSLFLMVSSALVSDQPQHKRWKRYNDCEKKNLKKLDMKKSDWENYALIGISGEMRIGLVAILGRKNRFSTLNLKSQLQRNNWDCNQQWTWDVSSMWQEWHICDKMCHICDKSSFIKSRIYESYEVTWKSWCPDG